MQLCILTISFVVHLIHSTSSIGILKRTKSGLCFLCQWVNLKSKLRRIVPARLLAALLAKIEKKHVIK